MRNIGAVAIALCGLFGVFAAELSFSGPAFAAEPSGSAGGDGDGDHMAGEEDNIDQVTNSGPNKTTPGIENAEKEAEGLADDD